MGNCCKKSVIKAEKAPKAIGAYSVGIKGGHFIFVSGQLGIDPVTGAMVEGGVEAETRQALTNLKGVLEAVGCDLSAVVKTTVFLRDINEFSGMNTVYSEFFKEDPPARSAFQVAALPKGAAVEIEAIAMAANGDCNCKE